MVRSLSARSLGCRIDKKAGHAAGNVIEKAYNIDVMAECNDPLYKQVEEGLPEGTTLGDYVVSVDITAIKS